MNNSLNTILTFLEANLATAVSEIESEQGITITAWRELRNFTPLGNQFPAIFLLPDDTDGFDEENVSAGNRAFYGNPSHRDDTIMIKVMDRGNKTTANIVETNIVGYMDALEKLFMGDYTLSGVKGVDIGETTYTPLFPDLSVPDEGLLLKGATLRLKVRYNIF